MAKSQKSKDDSSDISDDVQFVTPPQSDGQESANLKKLNFGDALDSLDEEEQVALGQLGSEMDYI